MTNRTIPGPRCNPTDHDFCPLCKCENTIPDRRTATASEDALRADVARLQAKLARYEADLTKEQIRAVSMELTTIESVAEHDAAIRKVRGEP